MIRTLRRRRRGFAILILGLWLFALGVAIAHACTLDGASGYTPHSLAHGRQAFAEEIPPSSDDDTASASCCHEQPFAAKIQPLLDPPGGQPLALTTFVDLPFASSEAPAWHRGTSVHRAIDVRLSIRYARLTL
ncbi:MAG TPA: hypothetical protein VGA51_00090 [Casimicrobiaceae bacterium]